MTNPQSSNTLVLKDQAGSYFLLSQETLERGRVPEEHTAEIERLIAEATEGRADGGDVQGHMIVQAIVVFLYGVNLGYHLTKHLQGPESQAPDLSSVMSSSASRP